MIDRPHGEFSIDSVVKRKDETDVPVYQRGTVYTIIDFKYSVRYEKWRVEYCWYNDSVDCGTNSDWIDDFAEEFELVVS